MPTGNIDVVWARGETRWRDLKPDITQARQVTVITEQSVYLLDLERGVLVRLPGLWANSMGGDATEVPLMAVRVATSCGLVLSAGEAGPRYSTPLLMVLAGWCTTGAVTDAVAALHQRHGGGPVSPPAHDGPPCGALYCSAERGGPGCW
jgi:hypothetical protein